MDASGAKSCDVYLTNNQKFIFTFYTSDTVKASQRKFFADYPKLKRIDCEWVALKDGKFFVMNESQLMMDFRFILMFGGSIRCTPRLMEDVRAKLLTSDQYSFNIMDKFFQKVHNKPFLDPKWHSASSFCFRHRKNLPSQFPHKHRICCQSHLTTFPAGNQYWLTRRFYHFPSCLPPTSSQRGRYEKTHRSQASMFPSQLPKQHKQRFSRLYWLLSRRCLNRS